jgi:hypothetical protein
MKNIIKRKWKREREEEKDIAIGEYDQRKEK